jgi:hypothetical protein
MPIITNKVTITQGQISVVLMLLEKWWNRPVPGLAAGHWYLDDGVCGAKIRLGPANTPEDNFWYYNPIQNGRILGIGAQPQTLDYDTNTIGAALNTYVALFEVTREASGRFSKAGGSGPGRGLLHAFGTAGLTPGKPVVWESEWGYGQYSCSRKWKWDVVGP